MMIIEMIVFNVIMKNNMIMIMIVMMFNNFNSLIGISKGAVSISSAAAEFTATKIESDCKVTSKFMLMMLIMMKMMMVMMKMKMIMNMMMIEMMSLILLITIMMMLMTMMLMIILCTLRCYSSSIIITIYLGMSDAHVTIIGAGKMARLLLIHLQTQGKDASCCRCLLVIRLQM